MLLAAENRPAVRILVSCFLPKSGGITFAWTLRFRKILYLLDMEEIMITFRHVISLYHAVWFLSVYLSVSEHLVHRQHSQKKVLPSGEMQRELLTKLQNIAKVGFSNAFLVS